MLDWLNWRKKNPMISSELEPATLLLVAGSKVWKRRSVLIQNRQSPYLIPWLPHIFEHFTFPFLQNITLSSFHQCVNWKFIFICIYTAPVIQWSEFLATDPEVRVRFPVLPEFLSSLFGTGSTQPREYN
jgi:hypothetical protein